MDFIRWNVDCSSMDCRHYMEWFCDEVIYFIMMTMHKTYKSMKLKFFTSAEEISTQAKATPLNKRRSGRLFSRESRSTERLDFEYRCQSSNSLHRGRRLSLTSLWKKKSTAIWSPKPRHVSKQNLTVNDDGFFRDRCSTLKFQTIGSPW